MKIYLITLIGVLSCALSYGQTQVWKYIYVGGKCPMCKAQIENICTEFSEVQESEWSSDDQTLRIVYDPTLFDLSELEKRLAQEGRDTEHFRASDEAYEELPYCCQYREEEEENHDHDPQDIPNRLDKKSKQSAEGMPSELEGVVVHQGEPLEGAHLYWLGTNQATFSDRNGYFELPRSTENTTLLVSYIGFHTDTILIDQENMVEINLTDDLNSLREVVITHKRSGMTYSYLSTDRVQTIDKEELLHAACCNLSESFETNATVDAAHTDAVTGTREIRMLGLAGPYIQITRENMPDTRGLASLQGLTFTPGSWIETIQINTGAGSVVNGFEAITGQINIELIKPNNPDPAIYLNLYGNAAGRLEANANIQQAISENWSTTLLLHGLRANRINDQNEDGFVDNPLSDQFIILNRHYWSGANNWEGQVGARVVVSDNEAGQLNASEDGPSGSSPWLSSMNNRHYNIWAKTGKVLSKFSSFGLQVSGSFQEMSTSFGVRNYDAEHLNLYANFIYQTVLTDSRHKIKTGLSYQLDRYDEMVTTDSYERDEAVPGIFGEYTYDPSSKFDFVLGMRIDHHSNYGFFTTPRIHVRYAPREETVFRFALGRGLKTANIFAENISLFASNREIIINTQDTKNPYGLDPEIAWTTGLSITQRFQLASKEVTIALDAYRTDFENQVIVDYDASPQTVRFYNLQGTSRANNAQLSLASNITNNFELRLAYRYNDVKVDYISGLADQPFTPKHRAFANLRYEHAKGWSANYTLNLQGSMRLPNTSSNPESFQMRPISPDYLLSNIQVSKTWNKVFDLYIGAENLFDYRQDRAIIDAENPFSSYFDATMVWAPIFGRNIYAGLRWRWNPS